MMKKKRTRKDWGTTALEKVMWKEKRRPKDWKTDSKVCVSFCNVASMTITMFYLDHHFQK